MSYGCRGRERHDPHAELLARGAPTSGEADRRGAEVALRLLFSSKLPLTIQLAIHLMFYMIYTVIDVFTSCILVLKIM